MFYVMYVIVCTFFNPFYLFLNFFSLSLARHLAHSKAQQSTHTL